MGNVSLSAACVFWLHNLQVTASTFRSVLTTPRTGSPFFFLPFASTAATTGFTCFDCLGAMAPEAVPVEASGPRCEHKRC